MKGLSGWKVDPLVDSHGVSLLQGMVPGSAIWYGEEISSQPLICYLVSRSSANLEIFYSGNQWVVEVGITVTRKTLANSKSPNKPSFPFISVHLDAFQFISVQSISF
jgi:hypothetical protein